MSTVFTEPPDDSVNSLLPAEDEPLTPEEEVAQLEDEFSEFVSSDDLVVVEEQPPPLGRSWAFQFSTPMGPRFNYGHGLGPLEVRGVSTLAGWVEKCLNTARGAHPIHPEGYGLERAEEMYGRALDFDGDLEARLRDALTFHPRIADVRDVVVANDPDEEYLAVDFTVVLDDDSTLELNSVVLNNG